MNPLPLKVVGICLAAQIVAGCPSPKRHAQQDSGARAAKPKAERAPDMPSKGPLAQKIYYEQAKGLLRGGRLEPAAAAFRRAIKAQESGKLSANCYLGLGSTLGEMGQHEAAVAAYRKVVLLSPTDPDAYRALAIGLEEMGKLAEAAESLKQSLNLDPDQLTGYSDLAGIYLRVKDQPNAQKAFLAYEARRTTLIRVLGLSKDEEERATAAALLGQARDESTAKALGLALSDGSLPVRLAVIRALGQQGLKAGAGPLRALLERSTDDAERQAIKQSLLSIASAMRADTAPPARAPAPPPAKAPAAAPAPAPVPGKVPAPKPPTTSPPAPASGKKG